MRNEQMKTNVIGTACLNTSCADLTQRLDQHARSGEGVLSVDFTNVHIVTLRRTDPGFARTTSSVDWFVPDSQVLKWAVNLCGGHMEERVYGPTFLDFAVRYGPSGTRHYFLGASQECLDLLLAKLRAIRPDLNVVGSRNGYFGSAENEEVVAGILAADPDFLWVGLGTPKQQQWIHAHKARFKRGAILAVGFAFDVNAGTKRDAPAWMGKCGLTWLYRLASEPRRLFIRYAYYNTLFLWFLFQQKCGRRFRPLA